jgi:hypothetical protein
MNKKDRIYDSEKNEREKNNFLAINIDVGYDA